MACVCVKHQHVSSALEAAIWPKASWRSAVSLQKLFSRGTEFPTLKPHETAMKKGESRKNKGTPKEVVRLKIRFMLTMELW